MILPHIFQFPKFPQVFPRFPQVSSGFPQVFPRFSLGFPRFSLGFPFEPAVAHEVQQLHADPVGPIQVQRGDGTATLQAEGLGGKICWENMVGLPEGNDGIVMGK